MSDLAKEVAEALKQSGLNWWQRTALIIAANVLGLVLGAIIISAGGIVYTKAMSTDDLSERITDTAAEIRKEMVDNKTAAEAHRTTLVDAMAAMQADIQLLKKRLDDATEPPVPGEAAVVPAEVSPAQQTAMEPSATDVREKKQELQQQIDKEVYRSIHLRVP